MENHKDYKLKSGNTLRVIQDENAESPDTWKNEDMFLVYDHWLFTIKRERFEPININEYLDFNRLPPEVRKEEVDDRYDNYCIFLVYAHIHSGINLSLEPNGDIWDTSTVGYVLVKKESLEVNGIDLIKPSNLTTVTDKDFKFYSNHCFDKVFRQDNKPYSINQFLKSKVSGLTEKMYKDWEENINNGLESKAREYAEGLIETWNQYLSGDVYGFQVLKPIKYYEISYEDLELITEHKPYKMGTENIILKYNFFTKAKTLFSYEEIDSCYGFYGSDPKTNGMLEHINDEILEDEN